MRKDKNSRRSSNYGGYQLSYEHRLFGQGAKYCPAGRGWCTNWRCAAAVSAWPPVAADNACTSLAIVVTPLGMARCRSPGIDVLNCSLLHQLKPPLCKGRWAAARRLGGIVQHMLFSSHWLSANS